MWWGVSAEIAVVVPFFDAADYLDRCLDGLLAQTWPADRLQIVFVDNNSRDYGPALVRARLEAAPHVRLAREAEQGAYAARNRGLAETHAPLVAFTDPDCVAEPTWLERLRDALLEAEHREVVMGRAPPVGESSALRLLDTYDDVKQSFIFGEGDVRHFFGHTNNMMVRRRAFDRLGPFEHRLRGGDTIFVQQVARHFGARSVAYVPDAVVHHLEVTRALDWYRKTYTYGRSARNYEQRVPVEALGPKERWAVYRTIVRRQRMSAVQAGFLLGLLGLGLGAWAAGRLRA